jgi:hypothetical protein
MVPLLLLLLGGPEIKKATQSSKFKGEANDVNQCLRQCENIIFLEASSFQNNGSKIRYTGHLLEGQIVLN